MLSRGISGDTYDRVMGGLRPDTTGLEAIRNQPEFNEQLWQYLNRRVSDWRILAGKEKAKEYAPLFSRIEKDFGVERSVMLGVWGVEPAFGDPVVQQHHMRPVIPSLATLAWAEPRRRDYWEMELINALTIMHEAFDKWCCPVPAPCGRRTGLAIQRAPRAFFHVRPEPFKGTGVPVERISDKARGPPMSASERLLRFAAECEVMAKFTPSPENKIAWRRMAER